MFPEWTLLSVTVQALRGQLQRARARPEAGLTTVEWVVLVAVVVTIAIAVGTILRRRIEQKANTIPLG
jgi:hypothetical protein